MKFEYSYPRPGCATTQVIVSPDFKEVLIGKRKETSNAFPGAWCLPGGMLEVAKERTINTARRETREETGLDIHESRWHLFMVDDTPGDDPRFDQIENICYYTHVTEEEYNKVKGADDITEVKWVSKDEARELDLAFNHNGVLEEFLTNTLIFY